MEIGIAYNVCCNECGETGNLISEEYDTEINLIELTDNDVYLCNDCLAELHEKLEVYLDRR